MSWSPSYPNSLPSLRPGQSSPAVPSGAKPLPSHLSPSQAGHNATNLTQHDSVTETPSPSKKMKSSRPLAPKQSHQNARVKAQDAALRYGLGRSLKGPLSSRVSPKEPRTVLGERRRLDKRVSAIRGHQGSKEVRSSSSKNSHQSSAKTESPNHVKSGNDNVFFFRLTAEELATFRRKHRKGATYDGFSDFAIAQELKRLGRGWEGYSRSRRVAEEEGRLDEFRRQFQTERSLMSTTLPLPVGAISMQAALDAVNGSNGSRKTAAGKTEHLPSHDGAKVNGSKHLSMTTVRFQQEPNADLGLNSTATGYQDYEGLYALPESPDPETADFELVPAESTDEYQPPESTAISNADSQRRHRGRPKGSKNNTIPSSSAVDRPRPRRVETRPDYRIRRIRETHPDLPPKPPSPTPRDLYDQSQPRFLQFKCEWAGCKAVLNNVATIRKHVGIVHGQEARDTLCCSWGKCGKDDSTGVLSVFRCIEELDKHLQALHMEPMKWHLGDGRLGQGLVVKESGMSDTSYLYSNGQQVTPSITKQRTETHAEWRARKERLKEILLKSAMNAPSDSELEGCDINEDTQDSVLS